MDVNEHGLRIDATDKALKITEAFAGSGGAGCRENEIIKLFNEMCDAIYNKMKDLN